MAAPETIYLDHNATTPARPEVVEAMVRCYAEEHANPASRHRAGQRARKVLEDARERIAEILGADLTCPQPDRLIFTSGGTEANNLALLGIAQAAGDERGDIIISSIEHPSVIEPAEHLLERDWTLHTLSATPDGVVRTDQLAELLCDRTRLVSVMLGNHETGVLQPVGELATVCNDAGVPMHTDAIQVAGKLPIDFRGLGVAAMSIAAHKFQGPPGIGALILRDDVPIVPVLFGGHQQSGLRPGTEPVAPAIGMWTALELWHKEQEAHTHRLRALCKQLADGIRAGFPGVIVHGEHTNRLPQTANIAFPGLDGQALLTALETAGVACAAGSACSSGSTDLSPTLNAMGLPSRIVKSSLRFSLGATTTEANIQEAVARILHACNRLQGTQK